jgi:hypothetical protein
MFLNTVAFIKTIFRKRKPIRSPCILSLSKDDRRATFRSWFDKLTTNGLAMQ